MPSFACGMAGLHRLGGDVRGRVPQDGQALRAVDVRPARPRPRRAAAGCRSRSSPLTRTATTVLSSR